MLNFDDSDINYVIYRSNDHIQNFKIRVKLERLTSNALLPSLPRYKIEDDLFRLIRKDVQKTQKSEANTTDTAKAFGEAKRSDYEEVIIGWQQKLFNRFEFETYGRDNGPHRTSVEQKYFDEIQKMKANRKQPGRIFTYIESDSNCLERNLDYFMTDSPNEQPTHLALGINTIRKRRIGQSRSILSKEDHLPKTDLINRKPTPDDLQINHLASLPYQTMYIMADLNDKPDTITRQLVVPQPLNEHVLCRISVYSNGTIVLGPDFNNGKVAYMIEARNLKNDVYQYFLEHASLSIKADDLIKERRLFNEICLRQRAYIAQNFAKDFDTPPPTVLKLNIFGEIVSGKNFEYDDTYVYYCLDLADNWHVDPSMILSGYTTTGSTTMSSKDDIVYYSHPFEFELWYKPSLGSADHEFPRMPKIYFQVASLDSWSRYRTEGYTYMDIPSFPGFYNEDLSCWRPRGDSIFNELRRFFIGGSVELEDLSYTAIPKLFEQEKDNRPLSRFGFRTISTGTLNIRLNVVFQSQSIAMEYKRRTGVRGVNRYGFDAFMSNINSVLDEFERAKQRALEVRETTIKMFETSSTMF